MKTIHRYILRLSLQNYLGAVAVFTLLFLMFDFFDRIDNILPESSSLILIAKYFLLRIPHLLVMTLPVGVLVGTLLTFGLLSKNSELTAMRAAGLPLLWIARPALIAAFGLSLLSILLSEAIVPRSNRLAKEIYNIDIRKKDRSGSYSQSDFWWRRGDRFYSVGMFDSRSKTLFELSELTIDPEFNVVKRLDASETAFVDPEIGWTMRGVTIYDFGPGEVQRYGKDSLPLPIVEKPSDFYDVKTDPDTMSFYQLRRFIREQSRNGLPIEGYLADLYEKLTFPFVTFFGALVVLPFSLRSARSGSMSTSAIAGLVIGFTYYAVHSFSIALGRAEIWHPFVAAVMAPLLMGTIGVVLNLGAEAPGD